MLSMKTFMLLWESQQWLGCSATGCPAAVQQTLKPFFPFLSVHLHAHRLHNAPDYDTGS